MLGWAVTGLSVNNDGIYIPDPIQTAQGNWTVSYMVTRHPVVDLQ